MEGRRVLLGVPLGQRVVVRYLIEDGARATDALGELVDRDDHRLVVRTKRGEVAIALAAVVAAKPVPPPPARRPGRGDDVR